MEASLQSQKFHNKWSDRSKVGIFLCHSPLHAHSVSLVLNTQTGNVSPQFHCLFDPDFNTCKNDVKFQSIWKHKATLHTDSKPTPSEPSPTHPHTASIKNFELALDIPAHLSQPWDSIVHTPKPSVSPLQYQQPLAGGLKLLLPTNTSAHSIETAPVQSLENDTTPVLPSAPAVFTRSGRQSKPPPKFSDSAYSSFIAFISTFSPQQPQPFQHLLQPDVKSQSMPHPFALASKHIYGLIRSEPDTMRLHEAMKETDRLQFLAAMKKELEDHVLHKNWKLIPLHYLPTNKRSLPMV